MTTRRRPTNGIPRTSRFGVYLDKPTRKALIKAAIDEDMSATELVEQLIHTYLATHARKASRKG